MVAGIPFPDIYDWTWGEILEYIRCKNEAQKDRLKADAAMLFKTAALIAKFQNGTNGAKLDVMNEFSWLWTDEERKEARVREIEAKFKVAK